MKRTEAATGSALQKKENVPKNFEKTIGNIFVRISF